MNVQRDSQLALGRLFDACLANQHGDLDSYAKLVHEAKTDPNSIPVACAMLVFIALETVEGKRAPSVDAVFEEWARKAAAGT